MSITRREFARRRERLREQVDERAIVIIPSAPRTIRNRDIEFPYRPDSDFYYLTGFTEPNSVAVLVPGRPLGEYILFCRERDALTDRWDGEVAGLEGACDVYGADDAFPIGDLDDILPGLLENRERIYCGMGRYPDFDQKLMGWVSRMRTRTQMRSGPAEIVALDHLLHEMRLHKSSAELRLIQRAVDITAAGHLRAMEHCYPGQAEYELEAELSYAFAKAGARAHAYPTIVAGGRNGCILHYLANTESLRNGDLVLVDAGAEFQYYAADVTRTYPVNGRFSEPQRTLYALVLRAQTAAIEAVRPGVAWEVPHQIAARTLIEGLLELGLLKGSVKQVVKNQTFSRFFIQPTGHWLGLDVHDVGDYRLHGEARVLEPGMVLTIEPGVYVRHDDSSVPAQWRGLGIRVEDVVVVTRDGHHVASEGIVKSIDEIEQAVGRLAAGAG
ncbi:MAG: aminopeptidase P N-terminal domain-containing protein [Gammaproteobacteria bacterium]|nr:aminopeptidase P N-terminal domain-containing protein [Gammaproteobacteria bacterium]